jgi:hypothetical protein
MKMNKLFRVIECKFTGTQRPAPQTFGALDVSVEALTDAATLDVQQEYIFQFLWRKRFFCRPRDLVRAKENVIRQFKADIFADVERLIIEGRQAAITGDSQKVLEILDKIEDEL